ncbi:GNAT family N-acetyltransferase [Variovorax humicola]|uniref:GNAT family N-acetyltransferase n=1 Tax=Variovorax humicola TaxID=1769758 RepID=A0ABU8VTP3_9BURK
MTPASTARIVDATLAADETAVVAGIWRRAWASAHYDVQVLEPIGHWRARVEAEFRPPNELLLAEREGQILAFMGLQAARRYVAQLYVDTHLQGQGLGRMMLDEACRRMPGGWRLHVATVNLAAQAIYARYGLVRGAADRHPGTGRARVEYHYLPR